jgi:hypothetical protein
VAVVMGTAKVKTAVVDIVVVLEGHSRIGNDLRKGSLIVF